MIVCNWKSLTFWAIGAVISGVVSAGPYSTGLENQTPGAIDPAIPGFVGPDGNGVVSAANSVNPIFVGWATSVESYVPAANVQAGVWDDPSLALGAVTGDNFDIVSLGDRGTGDNDPAGTITLGFTSGIRNGGGFDLAVFENGFGSDTSLSLELAFVEVSSDGSNFARFGSDSLTAGPIGAFGTADPTDVYNLAGKHANNGFSGSNSGSWGTPFDLEDLTSDALVQGGLVDLANIQYVRLIDVIGDGRALDASGDPIYDAWLTTGSGGFDLEAIGVINAIPEMGAVHLMLLGLLGAMGLRRGRRE